MKKVKLLEYEDFDEEEQEEIKNQYIEDLIQIKVEQLSQQWMNDEITEGEFFEELGADKEYAETVPWFTGSIYFDNHQEEVNEEADEDLHSNFLFTKSGGFIHREEVLWI